MITVNVTTRPTTKIVRVGDLPIGVDRQDVVDFALKAAGETRSSHVGTRVGSDWTDDGVVAIVTIHTD